MNVQLAVDLLSSVIANDYVTPRVVLHYVPVSQISPGTVCNAETKTIATHGIAHYHGHVRFGLVDNARKPSS